MKFTFHAATTILALLNASARANPASTAAADHHGEGDVDDVDADVVVSHHADSGSGAVLSNVQDDRRALEGSKSFKQPKRIRESAQKLQTTTQEFQVDFKGRHGALYLGQEGEF